MKSTDGVHFLGLDHVRGLAALLVVSWHFMHGRHGYPTPFNSVPAIFPLVLFDEGHVGVSVFMTLSGYLFAKLLDGKKIIFRTFLWNRVLRLAPLLLVVFALVGIGAWSQGELPKYAGDLLSGTVLPRWPNGGWSITVEVAALIFLSFCGCYLAFDLSGGFWNPTYPSKSLVWVVLPTVDGLCLSLLIAWYDVSFQWRGTRVARWIGKAGDYSYSIYLLHVFVVFKAAALVHERVMPLNNFYVSLAWSIVFFMLMMPIGYLSYRFIEAPFLAHKRSYTVKN